MLNVLVTKPVEAGVLLLGPMGTNDVTDFFFDRGAACTGSTYSPDAANLSRMLKTHWMPGGIDFKGFAHSHPGQLDRLSHGDMVYIRRLLEINPDMEQFIAPIVIPNQFRFRAWVVHRDNDSHAIEAPLEFIHNESTTKGK